MSMVVLEFELVSTTWFNNFGRKSDLTPIRRDALHAAALLWQQEYLQQHFA